MKAFCIFTLVIFAHSNLSFAQYQLIKSLGINEPTDVSIDKTGNVYLGTYHGDVLKYDPYLDQVQLFSPPDPSEISIIEARQGLRIFTFHRDLQQFRLMNRTLALNEDYYFPPELVGFAEIATSSFDNNVWLIDQNDFSLKKYNILSQSIISTTPLNLILESKSNEILYCKEYQNRLFISTKNSGIIIFDSFGNYLKTYPISNIAYFNFWEDTIYYLKENQLVRMNLYNDATTITNLAADTVWKFALVQDTLLYLFSEKNIYLYK